MSNIAHHSEEKAVTHSIIRRFLSPASMLLLAVTAFLIPTSGAHAATRAIGSGAARVCYPVTAGDGVAACNVGVTSGGVQEVIQLVTANVASAAQTVYGGNYIFSQTCTTYGTDALQVRGPDGATYQTVISLAASDTTGGTAVSLGSSALVKAVVTGTTGCNATLSRVP